MVRALLPPLFALVLAWLPARAEAGCTVELNSANSSQLQTLPGIGPAKAAAILDYRTQNGPFASVNDLDRVPGIGPATMANVLPLICVGTEGASAPAAADPGAASTTAATTSPTSTTTTSSAPVRSANAVDINSASAAQLQTLPGIGPAKAAAILDYRTKNGPFSSCADLIRVTGIGPATLNGLAQMCVATPVSAP